MAAHHHARSTPITRADVGIKWRKIGHFPWSAQAILLWGTVSADEINLPADPDALRALFADMHARIAASVQALEAERTAHEATRNAVKLTTLQIEKLKVQLSRLRRMKFGQSSERITEMG